MSSKVHKPRPKQRVRKRTFPDGFLTGQLMTTRCVDSIWSSVENVIQNIQNKNLSRISFEEIYRNVYTMIMQKHGERLYNGLKEVVTQHLQRKVRETVVRALNDNFLQTLNEAWIDHQVVMVMIRELLMYMERVYVQKNDVENVYNVGLIIFRDEIVCHERIRSNLRQRLLSMVMNERKGQVIDHILIKNACRMLMVLGINDRWFYELEFERPFLIESGAFYTLESEKFLPENGLIEYIKRVETCVNEEKERVRLYLDQSTEKRILDVVEEKMVKKDLQVLFEMENPGIFYLLKNMKTVVLRSMFEIVSRFDDGFCLFCDTVSKCLRQQGASLLNEYEGSTNAVSFIQKILDLKDLFDDCLQYESKRQHETESLNRPDKDYCELLKETIFKGFDHFWNSNSKSPEFLAFFIHDTLRKGCKRALVPTVLDKTAVLFCKLQEKDTFERFYRQNLAIRLLLNTSLSEGDEIYMISKLKKECGAQFTLMIERMIKDNKQVSIQTTSGEFKELISRDQNESIEDVFLSVRILTTSLWPKTRSVPKCTLPIELRLVFDSFEKKYAEKYSKRNLTLQPQLGTVSLNALFFGHKQMRKVVTYPGCSSKAPTGSCTVIRNVLMAIPIRRVLEISTYQMCVLMLFNDRDKMTFKEIQLKTDIPEKDLISTLQPLSLGKVQQRLLLRTPETKEIEPSNEFTVNEGFFSKHRIVKIKAIGATYKTESEPRDTRNNDNGDRRFEIDAAIVRIMKTRKKLSNNLLVSEVTTQLKNRFLPPPAFVKKRIESLIEREYLERAPENRQVYVYMP